MTDLIDVPALGERIVYTWPAEVAERLNRSYILHVAPSSLSTNSASPSTVTGMTFPVESSIEYRIEGNISYSCANTNQGIGFGYRHPGGDAHGLFQATGPSGFSTLDNNRLFENTANTDIATAFATVASGGSYYLLRFTLFYFCTANGTFLFRMQRNGTSGSTGLTIQRGSGAIVHLRA